MADLREATAGCEAALEVRKVALVQFKDARAAPADQVMVVRWAVGTAQFITGHAVAKVEPFDQLQVFQQGERPIDGGQVASAGWEGGVDLAATEGMTGRLQTAQNDLARASQPA